MPDHPKPPSRAVTQVGRPDDHLGYDTRDFWACAARMAEDALSGRNDEAMREEIRNVEQRLGMTSAPVGDTEPAEEERDPNTPPGR